MKIKTMLVAIPVNKMETASKFFEENQIDVYENNLYLLEQINKMTIEYNIARNKEIVKDIMVEWVAGLNYKKEFKINISVTQVKEDEYVFNDIEFEDKEFKEHLKEFYEVEQNIDLLGEKRFDLDLPTLSRYSEFILCKKETNEIF